MSIFFLLNHDFAIQWIKNSRSWRSERKMIHTVRKVRALGAPHHCHRIHTKTSQHTAPEHSHYSTKWTENGTLNSTYNYLDESARKRGLTLPAVILMVPATLWSGIEPQNRQPVGAPSPIWISTILLITPASIISFQNINYMKLKVDIFIYLINFHWLQKMWSVVSFS